MLIKNCLPIIVSMLYISVEHCQSCISLTIMCTRLKSYYSRKKSDPDDVKLKRVIGLWDGVGIIVNIVHFVHYVYHCTSLN